MVEGSITPDLTSLPGTGALDAFVGRLQCPHCRKPLRRDGAGLAGAACPHRFDVRDGIVHLAEPRPMDGLDCATIGDGRAYERSYQTVQAAAGYNRAYAERPLKQLTTKRELALLRTLLGGQGPIGSLLDLPAGGGRLSAPLAEATDLLVEADIAEGQLRYGAMRRTWTTPVVRMTASAFAIPIADRGVTGAVSIRLCHHLPTAGEREGLLAELLRVADRFVIMTFFDFRSVKNVLRRARRPFDRKAPKFTMRREDVAVIAARQGFALVRCPYLSFFGSGHRYALLVRHGAR